MVFFIKSAMANRARRNLLRATWASVSYLDGWHFSMVFLIGAADCSVAFSGSDLVTEQ